ncbi:MAG: carbohydrate ABC transporter permease [Chloroflexi bacterium]|nr:carbohydrate ABC transporter permease [Chloroflexota bacterium]
MRKVIIYALAALVLVWTVVPIYWLLNMTFMHRVEMVTVPTHLYPHMPTLFNFQRVLGISASGLSGEIVPPSGHAAMIKRGLANSLILSCVVTALTLVIAMPVAYALGRLNFKHKNKILFAILGSRSYPPITVVIPFFMLYQNVGLIGTHQGLVIIYLSATVPLAAWVMMGFFSSLPRSIEQEARLDGCTRWQAFARVLLPMSWPGLAATAIISFLSVWNEFNFAFFLAGGSKATTLPPEIAGMFVLTQGSATEAAAATTLAIVPPLLLAYVFQGRIKSLNIVNPL